VRVEINFVVPTERRKRSLRVSGGIILALVIYTCLLNFSFPFFPCWDANRAVAAEISPLEG
jgi:hypothetical protein